MAKQDRVKISQCMIVKNEEANIERALSWGKGIVSEQIVVDTGSTDRTVEIAKRMGATVYHFEWVEDFAAAKNYAIDKAKYDWIAFLDADEYFSVEDARKLLYYVEQLSDQYDGIITAWVQLDNQGNVIEIDSQMRVFRKCLQYHGRIHEYLLHRNKEQYQTVNAMEELSIYHTGYGSVENQEKKTSKRNIRLIQAELADHPDSWEMWGYLGNEFDSEEEKGKAEEAYRKAILLMPEKLEEYDNMPSTIFSRFLLLLISSAQPDETAIMDIYEQATACRPKEADFDYILGRYYASRDHYKMAEKHLWRSLELLEKHGNLAKSAIISGNIIKAYELLAICCYNNNHLADCVRLTTMLLKEDPYLMSTAVLYLSAFRKDPGTIKRDEEGALEVMEFMGKTFYDFSVLKDRLFVFQAAMGAKYEAMVRIMRRMFTPEELTAVDQSMKQQTEEQALRIVMFYSSTESFNFFTDQLSAELQKRGHEVFILDLENPLEEGSHSFAELNRFISAGVDAVVCFDGLGTRQDEFIKVWNSHQAVVVDILMDPPFRFHPLLGRHPHKYVLFCCDLEHVEYVKKYFGNEVPYVMFMPHVGVLPEEGIPVIPYKDRKYDILFSGTYYRPLGMLEKVCELFPDDKEMYYKFYEAVFQNLIENTELTIEQAVLNTLKQVGWSVSESELKILLNCSLDVDWAIRMYVREQVVTVLAEAGFELHLLGRGWENHPYSGLPNVHRIDDRIPYGETLAYMADAKINLNVMPWFKAGTHDRIFNTLLQRSVPLTDSSIWIDDNFTDGTDIAIYDLKHLEQLPDIVKRLLTDTNLAESIIENGYEKVSKNLTWSHCTEWVLSAIESAKKIL